VQKRQKWPKSFLRTLNDAPIFPKRPQIFFAFYTRSVPFSHWKWDLKKVQKLYKFFILKNLTKFLDRPSKILVCQIFGPFQKSVKIFANLSKVCQNFGSIWPNFWSDRCWTIQIFRIWMGQSNFLTWFSPPGQKILRFWQNFCQNLDKKFREIRNFLSPFWKFFSWKFPKRVPKSETSFRFWNGIL
jgi:hypothetical protein